MNRSIITNSLIAYLVVLSFLAGCKDNRPRIENHLKAFIMFKNAEGTFYDLRDEGAIQFSYRLKEGYPATSVLTQISTQLEGAGWQPLKEDFLNPALPSSHVKGWSYFEDASSPPTKVVYQWMGGWEDKHGNIVTYIFRYEYPKNEKKDLSHLQIYEIYKPASLVALTKQRLQREKVKQ